MGNVISQDDVVEAGFHRLDDKHWELRPPQITWGKQFQEWGDEKKLEYLDRLARTMNQAAAQIQKERDELGRLCEKKEDQIQKMKEALERNNLMLQQQVTKLNLDRQEFLKAIAELKQSERELQRRVTELEAQVAVEGS